MQIQHCTIAAVGRRRLFPHESLLRRAVRAVVRVAREALLADASAEQ